MMFLQHYDNDFAATLHCDNNLFQVYNSIQRVYNTSIAVLVWRCCMYYFDCFIFIDCFTQQHNLQLEHQNLLLDLLLMNLPSPCVFSPCWWWQRSNSYIMERKNNITWVMEVLSPISQEKASIWSCIPRERDSASQWKRLN